MAIDGNLVCKQLNVIKEKHGLSNKRWAAISGVPVGTINRYLSYNVGIPSFIHICAMLESVNEPLEDFYAVVNTAIKNAPTAVVPGPAELNVAAAIAIAPPDPTAVTSMQEAISLQSEVLVEQVHDSIENNELIKNLRIELDAAKADVSQKDVIIARKDTELIHKKKQVKVLTIVLLILAALEVLLANYGFVRGLF